MSGEVSVLKMIRSMLNVDMSSVSRVDIKAGYFSHLVFSEELATPEEFESPFLPTTCCAHVVMSGKPLIIEGFNAENDAIPNCPMMKAEGYKSYIGVPIHMDKMVVGAVEGIGRNPRAWSGLDLEQITKFARLIEALISDKGHGALTSTLRLVE